MFFILAMYVKPLTLDPRLSHVVSDLKVCYLLNSLSA
jgi:hypothetical protein